MKARQCFVLCDCHTNPCSMERSSLTP